MKLLVDLLFRIAGGERFKKATPEDYRHWMAYFFFVGLFALSGLTFGFKFLDQADAISIWIGMTALGALVVFGIHAFTQHVPAKVSFALGIPTWAIVVWLALTR